MNRSIVSKMLLNICNVISELLLVHELWMCLVDGILQQKEYHRPSLLNWISVVMSDPLSGIIFSFANLFSHSHSFKIHIFADQRLWNNTFIALSVSQTSCITDHQHDRWSEIFCWWRMSCSSCCLYYKTTSYVHVEQYPSVFEYFLTLDCYSLNFQKFRWLY